MITEYQKNIRRLHRIKATIRIISFIIYSLIVGIIVYTSSLYFYNKGLEVATNQAVEEALYKRCGIFPSFKE